MPTPRSLIDDSLVEAFLHCRYKSYLRVKGAGGEPSAFELHRRRADESYRARAKQSLLAAQPETTALSPPPADRQALSRGPQVLLNVALETNGLATTIDAVERIETPSNLGPFSYRPIQYCPDEKITRDAKLLLAYRSIVLGEVQGALPSHGTFIHGSNHATETHKLEAAQRKVRRILEGLKAQIDSTAVTPLVLNQHCSICEFQSRCREEAIKADDLSLLAGITERELKSQHSKGIFTVNQLSYTFRHRKPPKRAKHPANPHHFALQALSLRTNTVHVHGIPALPSASAMVYYDIEGLPVEGYYYLIGATIVQTGKIEHLSFWASSKLEQLAIFSQFIALVMQLPGCKLFHFGRYDTDALRRVQPMLDEESRAGVDAILKESTDVLSLIRSHVYFPTYSNGLKDIAPFLGFQWTDSSASGIQSIIWREEWNTSGDPLLQEKLIRYNREDCQALLAICEFIRVATSESRPTESSAPAAPKIANTKDMARPNPRWRPYQTPTFVLEDLERASTCAHFDYQRERVFTRTDKRLARRKKQKRRKVTSSRPNKRIEVTCECCPHCGNRNIRPMRKIVRRRVVDLKFSRTGVKKYIVEYFARRYSCNDCGKKALPEGWLKRESIYGEHLALWCVYLNVACKQPMGHVTATLKDLFLIDLRPEQARKFKGDIIPRYNGLYDELRRHILKSHVLHVDEGDVAIRKGPKGYVWVFATMDAVWYMYRDSRSGEFLKELLEGFSGVLVSDFYNAYDDISCPQQKCLVHLLRDLNEDLRNNPFDEEFRGITRRFGAVLRDIVDTIDRFGLTKRHLHKHKRPTEAFLGFVCSQSFSSEVAIRYQKRFNKYGSRLFTFLDYDNVPWNNACAEYSVKNFMRFKATGDGLFSERSLREVLVMLSVMQTCKLNGVNVLKFLLSKKMDIGAILGL